VNILPSLLLLGLGALPINAVLEEEISVLTAEDIERKHSPAFFAVHRVGDRGISIDCALKSPASAAADIGPYQLCVLGEPVTREDLPAKLSQANLIVRTQTVREERATFNLSNEEVPNSAVVIYLADPSPSGARNIRGVCLPLAELMKTVPLARRHPLGGADHPVT
jgi:hypothetical protein